MTSLEDFAVRIKADKTIILFGAGASIPSGAPATTALAKVLSSQLSKPADLSLSEICSIYEKDRGRRELAIAVSKQLKDLEPAGGLLLLPQFKWHRLYGTNYDQLIEKAYRKNKTELEVLVSNADFSKEVPEGTLQYLKIHGDMNQDVGFGNQVRMLLTESDYEDYADFREAAFTTLEADMMTKDLLIIGQSLADHHLRELVNKVAALRQKKGLPGRILLLTYRSDEDRARLFEDKGIIVSSGGIDDLMQLLINSGSTKSEDTAPKADLAELALPPELVAATVDVAHNSKLNPNPHQLFNGVAATYGDIAAGITFQRSAFTRVRKLLTYDKPNLVLNGAAGVGKTTLARQLCYALSQADHIVWEHKNGFPFAWRFWAEYERQLAEADKVGVIYIDDCITHLSNINSLLTELGKRDKSHLRVLVTAQLGPWRTRNKSSRFFSDGNVVRVSRLGDLDINSLLNLIAEQSSIRDLVDSDFSILPRHKQLKRLQERCAADMYVCLKNIFASEELDNILLREYADLQPDEQEIYRYVAALESLEARVHRQLILRVLKVDAQSLQGFLVRMDGILSEYDIKPSDGLYGWSTRHGVVAKTIATYKFHDQQELFNLFETIAENLNPNEWLEKDLARSMCQEEYGIQKLIDREKQLVILRSLVNLLPADRTVRHRLVKQYLDMDMTDEAAREIKIAKKFIGKTSTMVRYSVYVLIRRASATEGILEEDRIALLRDAESLAIQNLGTKAFSDDIHNYKAYGQVGEELAEKGQGLEALDAAIKAAIEAEERILDPMLTEIRRSMERQHRLLSTRRRV